MIGLSCAMKCFLPLSNQINTMVFLINTVIQYNKFNIQSFFSYNIKAKQYELYLLLGNIGVYNRNCNNVFSY